MSRRPWRGPFVPAPSGPWARPRPGAVRALAQRAAGLAAASLAVTAPGPATSGTSGISQTRYCGEKTFPKATNTATEAATPTTRRSREAGPRANSQ